MDRAWATPKTQGLPDLGDTKTGCCGVGKHCHTAGKLRAPAAARGARGSCAVRGDVAAGGAGGIVLRWGLETLCLSSSP